MAASPKKSYDREYFDHWYRKQKIRDRGEVCRQVHFAVALTELLLGRTIRNVLDIGCGEGRWRDELRLLRPRIRYQGVDPSDYIVNEFGKSHGVKKGSFGELGGLRLSGTGLSGHYDLVVCCDVLHYVPDDEVRAGLDAFEDLLFGVAYLDVFTSADDIIGDKDGFQPRSPGWYRRAFRAAGLVRCGPHAYATGSLAEQMGTLEMQQG